MTRDLEFYQWLKIRGLHPSVFGREDRFLVLGKGTEEKSLSEITEEDLSAGVVWKPTLGQLVRYLRGTGMKDMKMKKLESTLWICTVDFTEREKCKGAGRSPSLALIKALQNLETQPVL